MKTPTTTVYLGGCGGGGQDGNGGIPPIDSYVGGAGGAEGGGNGGAGNLTVLNPTPGATGAAGGSAGGGGGGGYSITGNGGAGGNATVGGGGGGGGSGNTLATKPPYPFSGAGGNSSMQGGGGGGGFCRFGNGGNGGNASFGGGGGGGVFFNSSYKDNSQIGGSGGSSYLCGGGGGAGVGASAAVSLSTGGQGGLGGGGGGASSRSSTWGAGGFGAGNGGAKGQDGSGGSAFGGAVFIAENGTLNMFQGGAVNNKAVSGVSVEGDGFYLMSSNLTFPGSHQVVIADSIAGQGTITKTGQGLLELSADNRPFSGTTLIEQGTLLLTGVLEDLVITTNSGILSGTGRVHGTLQNGGKVSPGNPTGVLTVNGPYTQSGALLINALNADHFGKLVVNGKAQVNGNIILNFLPGEDFFDGDQIVILQSNQTITGTYTFTTQNEPSDVEAALINEGNSLVVYFTVILHPPTHLKGEQIKNIFPTQTEYVNRLTWQKSPTAGVAAYIIYRNGVSIGKVLAKGPLVFDDHNQPKGVAQTYVIRSADSEGNEGPPATVVVPHPFRI